MQIVQEPGQAASRRSPEALMAFAEYGLKLKPLSFRPVQIGPAAWILLAKSEEGIALGYIKEGIVQ